MSSPWKKQPEDVADCVLKRAEVSKVGLHPLPSHSTSTLPWLFFFSELSRISEIMDEWMPVGQNIWPKTPHDHISNTHRVILT